MRLLLVLATLFGAADASGCAATGPNGIAQFAAYDGIPDVSSYVNEDPVISIFGCAASSRGKYIMLTLGADQLDLTYGRGNSWTDYFFDDYCRIEDAPVALSHALTYEEKLALYKKRTAMLMRCVEIEVSDSSRAGLQLPAEQPNCSIRRIDANTVVAQGGFCFFRINQDSDFKARYRMREECSHADFLRSNDIQPQDVAAATSIYVAGDATGFSLDLEHIDMIDARFTIEPSDRLLPLSTNFGTGAPRWPNVLATDLHMGELKIAAPGGSFPIIQSSFLVDNNCPQTCTDGLCAGPCDYAMPAAAEATLFRLGGDQERPRILDMWYQGGVAPARWQGLLPGQPHELGYNPFEIGKRYRLQFKFAFPDSYYRIVRDGFKQFLITLVNLRRLEVGADPLPPMATLSPLRQVYKQMPVAPVLPDLHIGNTPIRIDFKDPLRTLASYLDLEGWPPYIEDVCSPDRASCGNPYAGHGVTVVSADFDVSGISETGDLILSQVVVRRTSDVLEPYELPATSLPRVVCGGP